MGQRRDKQSKTEAKNSAVDVGSQTANRATELLTESALARLQQAVVDGSSPLELSKFNQGAPYVIESVQSEKNSTIVHLASALRFRRAI